MFPFHLRFSIHAHNNAGPKYAVKMWPNNTVTISGNFDDHLHIPTPWHNAVLRAGDKYVVGRVAQIQQMPGVCWNREERCFEHRAKRGDGH